MPDNPKMKGKADRDRVAGGQKHEVAYEAKKVGKAPSAVKAAVKAAGPMRKNVEKKLRGEVTQSAL